MKKSVASYINTALLVVKFSEVSLVGFPLAVMLECGIVLDLMKVPLLEGCYILLALFVSYVSVFISGRLFCELLLAPIVPHSNFISGRVVLSSSF